MLERQITLWAQVVCQVVVEAEISRDKVPLRNAYKHVGQRASLRVSSGVEHSLLGTTQSMGAYQAAAWTALRMLSSCTSSCSL